MRSKTLALNDAELQEILAIQKWGTYSSKYPLLYCSSLNGSPARVESFGIDNLPKLDVLFVFGYDLRLVKYAGEIVVMHDRLYPEQLAPEMEIAFLGYPSNSGKKLFETEAWFYASLMLELGFDSERIQRNLIRIPHFHSRGVMSDMRRILQDSDCLNGVDCPQVGVLTDAGASLALMQKLAYSMNEVQFYVFETPTLPPVKGKTGFSDIRKGCVADMIIANALNTLLNWNNGRLSLSKEKVQAFPNPEGIAVTVRRYFEKGYALGLSDSRQWDLMGIAPEKAQQLFNKRKEQITGEGADGDETERYSVFEAADYFYGLVDAILHEWAVRGISPKR